MSILDTLPHVCDVKYRTRTKGTYGGSKDSFTTSSADVSCWRQAARESEVLEFDKRGISVTDKVYFTSDPSIDENHVLSDLRDSGQDAGTGTDYEVRTKADPDASAGLGVVWRVMVENTTVGSTSSG